MNVKELLCQISNVSSSRSLPDSFTSLKGFPGQRCVRIDGVPTCGARVCVRVDASVRMGLGARVWRLSVCAHEKRYGAPARRGDDPQGLPEEAPTQVGMWRGVRQAYEGLETANRLREQYMFIPDNVKDVYVLHLLGQLEERSVRSAIIFVAQRRTAHLLGLLLDQLDFPAAILHSGLPQTARLANLQRYRAAPPGPPCGGVRHTRLCGDPCRLLVDSPFGAEFESLLEF